MRLATGSAHDEVVEGIESEEGTEGEPARDAVEVRWRCSAGEGELAEVEQRAHRRQNPPTAPQTKASNP